MIEGTEGDSHIKRVSRLVLTALTQIELPTVRAMTQTGLLACTRVARQVTLITQVLARLAFVDRDVQPQSHVAILTFAF